MKHKKQCENNDFNREIYSFILEFKRIFYSTERLTMVYPIALSECHRLWPPCNDTRITRSPMSAQEQAETLKIVL